MKQFSFMKKYISMEFSSYFSYRTATFIQIISDIVHNLTQPLILFFIYSISKGLPGWSIYELIAFNATAILSLGLAGSTIIGIIFNTGKMINDGSFDIMLLKPANIITQIIITAINPWWTSDIIIGITLLITSIIKGGLSITITGVLTYIYLITISMGIFFGIIGAIIGLTFKYYRADRIIELFWIINSMSKYPLNIYNKTISLILTFIIPLSIANYYPASYLLGKITSNMIIIQLTITSIIFIIIGLTSIKIGLKYYTSAGG